MGCGWSRGESEERMREQERELRAREHRARAQSERAQSESSERELRAREHRARATARAKDGAVQSRMSEHRQGNRGSKSDRRNLPALLAVGVEVVQSTTLVRLISDIPANIAQNTTFSPRNGQFG
ncbi:hypothetical protein GC098_38245 [Paenibacillus sp. LMG 31458]|uniref:Uncharacterized protein n=1 Tax=Paenibacillus phytorum TaxID=2654977 RepID=A0ABX1Y9N7_9BACL|nr:hypothetical protein [Paenibacillus phytorum]NOU77139.1 hypothetical protein [Paenibacillus phytorum]